MNEAIFSDYNKPLRSGHMNLDFPKNGLRDWGEDIYKSIIFAHSELVPNFKSNRKGFQQIFEIKSSKLLANMCRARFHQLHYMLLVKSVQEYCCCSNRFPLVCRLPDCFHFGNATQILGPCQVNITSYLYVMRSVILLCSV